jgi:hypothetical protein
MSKPAMAEGLQQSSSLRDLSLFNLTISDKAAAALAEVVLVVKESLKRLSLYKCHLSDQAAVDILPKCYYGPIAP